MDADFYGGELVVGFSNDKWGKSWGTVNTLIRKKCGDATLLPITQAIESGAHPKVLRLVEDGLFSGTELRAILDSLRGTRAQGRDQKVPKLDDPTLLSRAPTQVHFGAVCDFGEAIVRHYTAKNGLPNIQIAVSAAARKFRVLQLPSLQANGQSGDDETFRRDLRSRVIPHAFQDDKEWKNAEVRDRARGFCETVGAQLWLSYIAKKNFDQQCWPDERIKRCALGMESLGLAFAFPHSVPKASLPIFWARGTVTVDDVSLDWVPLFPNADN